MYPKFYNKLYQTLILYFFKSKCKVLVTAILAFTVCSVNTIQYLDDSHIGKPCNTVKEQWFDRLHPW